MSSYKSQYLLRKRHKEQVKKKTTFKKLTETFSETIIKPAQRLVINYTSPSKPSSTFTSTNTPIPPSPHNNNSDMGKGDGSVENKLKSPKRSMSPNKIKSPERIKVLYSPNKNAKSQDCSPNTSMITVRERSPFANSQNSSPIKSKIPLPGRSPGVRPVKSPTRKSLVNDFKICRLNNQVGSLTQSLTKKNVEISKLSMSTREMKHKETIYQTALLNKSQDEVQDKNSKPVLINRVWSKIRPCDNSKFKNFVVFLQTLILISWTLYLISKLLQSSLKKPETQTFSWLRVFKKTPVVEENVFSVLYSHLINFIRVFTEFCIKGFCVNVK